MQKQIIEQKLLDIYHTTSTNTKNNARKKLQDIYGKHFTDTSWEQFEKFVELHKYGMVFVTPNNNEYLVATGTVTGVSVPVGYVLMKAAISQAETTSSVGTLVGEESIPLLDIGEGGAWLVGEEAVAEGAAVMVEGGAVLGPVGLVIGAGVVIVGGIAYIYIYYNWSHAHNADINSHNQYNQIEKYYIPLDIKTPPHRESSKLKLGISNNMWMQLAEIYQDNKDDYQIFEKKFLNEIAKFPHLVGTLANGISDDNLKTLIKVMYDNFAEINIFYMMTNQHGWKIVTNAGGNYFEIEPE